MPDAPLSTSVQPLLRQTPLPLAAAAQVADGVAAARIFELHRERLSEETCRRHRADLALFATFLETSGAVPPSADLGERLLTDPASWTSVSWGLVQAFLEWQLQTGYAIGSINVRLSTVKAYAALATRAGALDPNAYALIKLVPGLRHAQGRRIDRQRETTRVGAKKAAPTSVSTDQAGSLKHQQDLLIRLLMCLLVDHGLR
ncbi:MAG TPA: hypothetical protein VFS21_24990, partial [Roseiflexaceae bacterium]|nr:hypothetical protein [Roseiflexaceae bacterium]